MGHILPPAKHSWSPQSVLSVISRNLKGQHMIYSCCQFHFCTVSVDAEEWLWTHRMEAASWKLVRTRWFLRRYCEYPTFAVLVCNYSDRILTGRGIGRIQSRQWLLSSSTSLHRWDTFSKKDQVSPVYKWSLFNPPHKQSIHAPSYNSQSIEVWCRT